MGVDGDRDFGRDQINNLLASRVMVKHVRTEEDAAEEIARLRAELVARGAEAEWLRTHYDRHLREAIARGSRPLAETLLPVHEPLASTAPELGADLLAANQKELKRLRTEVERLLLAERRYLDRIEELKAAGRQVSSETSV